VAGLGLNILQRTMDLTPGERAVLGQLRDLYATTSKAEHSLATIVGQWQPIAYEAYKSVLKALVAKGLLEATNKGQAVAITAAGLKAMGIAAPIPAPRPASPRKTNVPARSQTAGSVSSEKTATARRRPEGPATQTKLGMGVVGILGLLAGAVGVWWLLMRFF
jgi:hypothetical protein